MYKYLFVFLVSFVHSGVFGQQVPDFTVTDPYGTTHHLYADYLGQGKIVVLKFFFVECPPCQSIAPYFEDLYQEWGGGNGDVEFIALVTKTYNSNNNSGVVTYMQSHNLNYIGIGNDGGSLAAAEPYIAGLFGHFYGTPTFAVIGPDGSVIFDPSAWGNEATMEAVNQAILDMQSGNNNNTNTQTSFEYELDMAPNQSAPIDSVFLQNGDGSNRVYLADESFSLPDEDLYPGINDPHLYFTNNEKPYVGLDLTDIIKLRKHILKLDKFEVPNSLIAGDLNQDDVLNIADIIILTKLVLRIYDGLPNGTPMYRYMNDACPVTDPHCINGIPLSLTPGSTQSIPVEVLKIGDVSVWE